MRQLPSSSRKDINVKLESELIILLQEKLVEEKKQAFDDFNKKGVLDLYSRSWDRSSFIRRIIIQYLDVEIEYE